MSSRSQGILHFVIKTTSLLVTHVKYHSSLTWPDRYFLCNGTYRLEIISAYSEKGSGPKLKPYSHWTPKVWGVLIASVTISASYSLLSKLQGTMWVILWMLLSRV